MTAGTAGGAWCQGSVSAFLLSSCLRLRYVLIDQAPLGHVWRNCVGHDGKGKHAPSAPDLELYALPLPESSEEIQRFELVFEGGLLVFDAGDDVLWVHAPRALPVPRGGSAARPRPPTSA